nr:synthetic fusion protein [unidentified cloning vector]
MQTQKPTLELLTCEGPYREFELARGSSRVDLQPKLIDDKLSNMRINS